MHYYIICNPVAGGGRALDHRQTLEAHLQSRGISYEIALSQYAGHTVELARQAIAAGHTRILTIGGDGTVNQAMQGYMLGDASQEVALGFLPGGTGNDYTRTLLVPRGIVEAFDALHEGKCELVDVFVLNDTRYFLNVFGLGLDTALDAWSQRTKKISTGLTAYILALFLTLFSYKLPKIRLTCNGQTLDRQILVLTATSGKYYGGGIPVSLKARPADGKIDICLIGRVSKLAVPFLLLKYLKGVHVEQIKACEYYVADGFTIEYEHPYPCETDGEVQPCASVQVRLADKRLRVLTPLAYNPEV